MLHVAEQPSQLVVLPSSHSSAPHTTPSPQPVTTVQAFLQPSQLVVLPSSHCSAPQTTPSPQPVTSVQALLQPSQLFVLPSSHSSPGSTIPLPQTAFFGGSSILTNFPRPIPSLTSGSSDLQV